MWNDICYLGTVNISENEFGDTVKTIEYADYIFCNEKSIGYSQFYQAQAVGMKPTVAIEIHLVDYNKELFVKYDDEEYTVLRTYKNSPDTIELTLTRGVNYGSS